MDTTLPLATTGTLSSYKRGTKKNEFEYLVTVVALERTKKTSPVAIREHNCSNGVLRKVNSDRIVFAEWRQSCQKARDLYPELYSKICNSSRASVSMVARLPGEVQSFEPIVTAADAASWLERCAALSTPASNSASSPTTHGVLICYVYFKYDSRHDGENLLQRHVETKHGVRFYSRRIKKEVDADETVNEATPVSLPQSRITTGARFATPGGTPVLFYNATLPVNEAGLYPRDADITEGNDDGNETEEEDWKGIGAEALRVWSNSGGGATVAGRGHLYQPIAFL